MSKSTKRVSIDVSVNEGKVGGRVYRIMQWDNGGVEVTLVGDYQHRQYGRTVTKTKFPKVRIPKDLQEEFLSEVGERDEVVLKFVLSPWSFTPEGSEQRKYGQNVEVVDWEIVEKATPRDQLKVPSVIKTKAKTKGLAF